MKIIRMSPEVLSTEWERSVQQLVELQVAVDDELTSAKSTMVSLLSHWSYAVLMWYPPD